MNDHGLGLFLLSAFVIVTALAGLFLASRAVDGAVEFAGLALFCFMTLFGFSLIARATRPVSEEHASEPAE